MTDIKTKTSDSQVELKDELPVVVYSPESRVRHPKQLIKDMGRDLLASRELAWRIMLRDVKSKYRQSIFGVFWIIVPSLLTAVGFTLAKDVGILNIAETDIPYPVYVMLSSTIWQTFIQTIQLPIMAVNSGKSMMTKIKFPHEALVLAKLGEAGIDLMIKLVVVAFLFIWFKVPVTWSILIAPVPFIHLILLATGIGLILAPLNSLYNDVSRFLNYFNRIWWFITPVVYPPPTDGMFKYVVNLNPVTPLLVTTRDLATTGVVSDAAGFWTVSAIAFVIFLIGWIFFRLSMPFIVERMSS